MNTLYMKIHSYDENSHSLIVSFASDTTKSQDPNSYRAYAFQPMKMWPDVNDPQEVAKRIACAGMGHAKMQEIEENFVADTSKVDEYKNLVGSELSFSVSDLTVPFDASTDPELNG